MCFAHSATLTRWGFPQKEFFVFFVDNKLGKESNEVMTWFQPVNKNPMFVAIYFFDLSEV